MVVALSLNFGYSMATLLPPLERTSVSDLNILNSFGTQITGTIKVGQQIQIAASITNNQDKDQQFAYIVQIENQGGSVIQLSWVTGSLSPGQIMSPSQSWAPVSSGNYTSRIFVWAGINNPDALSPPLSVNIQVK